MGDVCEGYQCGDYFVQENGIVRGKENDIVGRLQYLKPNKVEIAELKEKLEEAKGERDETTIINIQLSAHIERLREYVHWSVSHLTTEGLDRREALLKSTPKQSLAQHDKKFTDEIAELKESAIATDKALVSYFDNRNELSAHIERLMVLAQAIVEGECIEWLVDKATMLVNMKPKQSLAHIQADAIEKMLKELHSHECEIGVSFEEKDAVEYAEQLKAK